MIARVRVQDRQSGRLFDGILSNECDPGGVLYIDNVLFDLSAFRVLSIGSSGPAVEEARAPAQGLAK